MTRAARGLVLALFVIAALAAAVFLFGWRRRRGTDAWDPSTWEAGPPPGAAGDVAPAAPADPADATPAEFRDLPDAAEAFDTQAQPGPVITEYAVPETVVIQLSEAPPAAEEVSGHGVREQRGVPGPVIIEYAVPETVVFQLSDIPADQSAAEAAGQALASAPGAPAAEPGPVIIDYGVVETQVIALHEDPPVASAPSPPEQQATVIQYPSHPPRVFVVDNTPPPAPAEPAPDNTLVEAFERLASESPTAVPEQPAPPVAAGEPAPVPGPPPPAAEPPAAALSRAPQESTARAADAHLDEGNVYFNVGQYILAIECYTRAIEAQPDLVAAYYNRANARTRLGHYGQALADYDRALELDETDADALNNRGMLHLYRADYPAALHDFDHALEIDPGDTTIMVNRGLAHLHGGNASDALVDFTAATKADPGDAAAHYGCAQATATLDEREEALSHLKTALSLDRAYAREAAADPKFASLQGDESFLRLLREAGQTGV